MFELKGKNILILSPQSWGKMMLSKHHYAFELARKGNNVFFLDPPIQEKKHQINSIQIQRSDICPNLFLIKHKLFYPYNIKFHSMVLFKFLMKFHIKKVLERINERIDIIWSFDLGNLYLFSWFPNTMKIFHPVDEPLNKNAIESGKGAHIIFSVTNEILDKYKHLDIPSFFLNHGVSDEFFHQPVPSLSSGYDHIRVGISGNLLRQDIDRPVLLQIIKANRDIIFEIWGSYRQNESNIGGFNDADTVTFIDTLQNCSNVILHGAVSPNELQIGYSRMSAFLICYDVEKDQSKGTNYHKIMEFLSTGKTIISNNITTYANDPELISMIADRKANGDLLPLFNNVIRSLDVHNSTFLQEKRKKFAWDNSYKKQVEKIEEQLKKIV
jgi:hypothetical protein